MARLQLQIQGTSNFAFDVEGEWYPSMQPEYKTAANPPQIASIQEVWEFQRCRIVSSDGTTATLWDEYLAFRARLEDRDAHPTYVRLVRDPSGANTTELTLGPTGGYEGLRFEVIDGEQDPQAPDASWNRTATFTIRVTAVKKLADANGIVGWNQEVSVNYDPASGLRTLRWETRITTEEGTSAVTKAATYAKIPVSALGSDHSYTTNSPDGIGYVYTDADEQNSRTPTVVLAVSEITQWGVTTGVTAAGGSPGAYDYSVTTRTTKDEVVTTYFASAQGPNASTWVASRAPVAYSEKEVIDRQAVRFYATTWIKRTSNTAGSGETRDQITVTITGGQSQRLRPITGGYPARRNFGAFGWWTATVQVLTRKVGTREITLPGLPGSPWELMALQSSETEPVEDGEAASTVAQTRYARQATLILTSTEKPRGLVSDAMRQAARVKSYFLEA